MDVEKEGGSVIHPTSEVPSDFSAAVATVSIDEGNEPVVGVWLIRLISRHRNGICGQG